MRILITGGAGYIGSHTLLSVLAADHQACVIDNFSNSHPDALTRVGLLSNRSFDIHQADLRDGSALTESVAAFRPDIVVHFAGLKAVGESEAHPLSYYEQNVFGTIRLLQAMDAAGCRSIVFSSSATVYGIPQYLPYDEAHPVQPVNPYGRTKYFIEEIIRDWAATDPAKGAMLLRYFNPVGADESGQIGEDPMGVPNNLMPYIARVAIGRLDRLQVFGDDYDTDDSEDDELEDWGDEGDENDEKYWFTKDKIDRIASVHNYLDSLPQVGKVISFSSIIDVATQLNNNKPLGTLEMGVLYSKIPQSIKTEIIDPYLSIKNNEARINLRIIDSQENLRRNDLINKINFDLKDKLGLQESEFKLAGVLILFNNLLQSLFKSQILTLGLVMIGIFSMFVILFRNIKLSLIGVVPNFIAAFFILGIIGLLGIPLDMMTITIAAITIGIAVDNSIHYIYRFKEEFGKIKDYSKTLKKCHSTVGVAILNTSITIVFGFSILVLSKFIPTIYFGVFTGIAMLLAMISVLTLLPALILTVKPFGK